jgi:uncharacterized membrane protein
VATVTVLTFPAAGGAEEALAGVQHLQAQHLLMLHDAALVSWPAGKKSPSAKQLVDLVAMGALGGIFWGMLFGLIFFNPLFGLAIDAVGPWGGVFKDYGIDDGFIARVRSAITIGTSALFLMTSDVVLDQIVQELQPMSFDIIATNLSDDQERRLRDAFVHR